MRTVLAVMAMIAMMFVASILMQRSMSLGSAFLLLSFAGIATVYMLAPGRDL